MPAVGKDLRTGDYVGRWYNNWMSTSDLCPFPTEMKSMRVAFLLVPITVLLVGACTEGGDAPTDAVWAGSGSEYGSSDSSANTSSGGTGTVDSGGVDSGGTAAGGSPVSACTHSSDCNDDKP